MLPFLCLLLFILAFNRFLNKPIVVFAFFLFFAFLVAFRGPLVGADTHIYINIWKSLARWGYNGYPEWLYAQINLFGIDHNLTFNQTQMLMEIIVALILTFVTCKSSVYPGYSIFVFFAMYFVFYSMNISRQMIAVPIVLLGYYFLTRNRKYIFVLCVFVASLFHTSAWIALIALGANLITFNNRIALFVSMSIAFALGMLLSDDMFISLLSGIGGEYVEYLERPSAWGPGFRGGERILLGALLTLFWDCLFVIILCNAKRQCLDSLWMKIYFLAIIFVNLTTRMELGLRIVLYFSISQIILFPLFIKYNKMKFKPAAPIVISGALILFFCVLLGTNSAKVLPYYNVLVPHLF